MSTYTLFSIVNNAIKPKFSGIPLKIPLNAVMFASKNYDYVICQNGAIPMYCYIDPEGQVRINTMCKLSLPDDFCVQQKINPFILYFSNFGAEETMALNLNSKNIVLTNITYDEAMYFLPQFDEIKYQVKEIYTYWKLSEVNVSYKSDYIQRMKEKILIMNPIKQNPSRIASASPEQQLEKPKDYAKRIAKIFRQECINIITKYSVPTMIMRFTIPAMIHNVQFEIQ
ncbi:MAG: hypothetical protein EZS28_014826 [Streblomastix strix]|uniref:Uncharacterized protein n=1 Tax=Streblomastix strix TaxID=222440 RepID=A0A5J4W4J1_9EUKA|nr:MAG: hypothetical protein EZS28_014826 [Streblomastix strix]